MLQLAILNEYLKKNWLFAMKYFLQMHKLFTNKKLKKVVKNEVKNFHLRELNKKKTILIHLYNNVKALFLKKSFWCNLMKWMHCEFEHLRSSNLLSVLHTKAWWSIMKKNVQKFLQKCLNCQILQDLKKKLKCEIAQH